MGLEMLQEVSAVRLSETEVRSTPCRDGLGMVFETVFLGFLELSLERWNQHSPGKKGALLAEESANRGSEVRKYTKHAQSQKWFCTAGCQLQQNQ